MKRAISIILVFAICLAMGACGSRSKYVGTYKNSRTTSFDTFDSSGFGTLYVELEMVLSRDGSGTLVMKSLDDNSNIRSALVGDDGIKKGDILIEYALTWEETENYITISGSGTNYTMMTSGYLYALHPTGTPEDLPETRYRLDGDLLVPIAGNGSEYQKVG